MKDKEIYRMGRFQQLQMPVWRGGNILLTYSEALLKQA